MKGDFHLFIFKKTGMKKNLKRVIGIDVDKTLLVVCDGVLTEDLAIELVARKTFPNSVKGFEALVNWTNKSDDEVRFVMEATGVYFESLAYYLFENGYRVSVVLPNKVSNYFKSLEVKTVTDKTMSETIASFGLSRNLDNWIAPAPTYKGLKQLTRERGQIVELRTMAKNQLHAEQSEGYPNSSTLARINKHIQFLNKQEKQIQEELQQLLKKDPEIKEAHELLCTIPGVGILTAATVLAETNGFNLIKNKRQLASYAGLDVKEKQSGTSIKGKPRISKRGNKYLRKAMHFPALAAIRHDERCKSIFIRLVSKHGIKMKAAVAVQRKILELMFTIYKTRRAYDKEYFKTIGVNSLIESV